jgi:hypothetical protein
MPNVARDSALWRCDPEMRGMNIGRKGKYKIDGSKDKGGAKNRWVR